MWHDTWKPEYGLLLDPKDGGDIALQNVGLPSNYTALQLRRPHPTSWQLKFTLVSCVYYRPTDSWE
jgi:hypothetical protein